MPIYGYQGRLGGQDEEMQRYVNQARGQNPIGRLGQLSNFAALEQAGQARTAQQRSQVEAAARALEQQSQQESSAAEQRGQVARSQQLQEQQQRLEQERFNQQLALQRTQMEEQKAYRNAQEEAKRPKVPVVVYSRNTSNMTDLQFAGASLSGGGDMSSGLAFRNIPQSIWSQAYSNR